MVAVLIRGVFILFLLSCQDAPPQAVGVSVSEVDSIARTNSKDGLDTLWWVARNDIIMEHYFESMNTICSEIDSIFHIAVNEYEMVHCNPFILDTLIAQDYYIAKATGRFIDDQHQCVVIHTGDSLRVPTLLECDSIQRMFNSVVIDVNIPEFTLRILLGDSTVHSCSVRVGRNERKYLALAGHEVDLRTPVGEGNIIRIERNPAYIDPVDGRRYYSTLRDDGVYTKLPRIPFLEPVIAGRRTGSLLHPTTKRSTLGKAYSNGCVGMSEADAWIVYYYAPLGTKVRFRYNLELVSPNGEVVRLKDIYGD